MLVEFSIFPLGEGASVGDKIAGVLKIIDESGLPYKFGPMGTTIEGDWNSVMKVIRKCHQGVMKNSERVVLHISIDDRKGRKGMLEEKVKTVEKKLGKRLRK